MSLWVNENGTMKELAIDKSEIKTGLVIENFHKESAWDLNLDQQFSKILDWTGWGKTLDNTYKGFLLKIKTITLPFSCNRLGVYLYRADSTSVIGVDAIVDDLLSTVESKTYTDRYYSVLFAQSNNGIIYLSADQAMKLTTTTSHDNFIARNTNVGSLDYISSSGDLILKFIDNQTAAIYMPMIFKSISSDTNTYPTRAQIAACTITKNYGSGSHSIFLHPME